MIKVEEPTLLGGVIGQTTPGGFRHSVEQVGSFQDLRRYHHPCPHHYSNHHHHRHIKKIS